MSVYTLVLIFTAISILSFLLVRVFSGVFASYWEFLVLRSESHLRHANRFENPKTLVASYLVIVFIVAVTLIFAGAGLLGIVLALCCLLLVPNLLFRLLIKQRVQRINTALPDALSQISAAMRAGSTFQTALQTQVDNNAGALEQEFAIVLRECRVGVRMEDALENLAERSNSEEIDLLVSAATIAQEVGGNLSDALQGLSDTIRRKLEMEGKIQSLTAQGRLQGHVVTALPLVMLLGLCFVEPETTLPMFSSLLGWIVLLIMFVLQITGALMISKIVSIDI